MESLFEKLMSSGGNILHFDGGVKDASVENLIKVSALNASFFVRVAVEWGETNNLILAVADCTIIAYSIRTQKNKIVDTETLHEYNNSVCIGQPQVL